MASSQDIITKRGFIFVMDSVSGKEVISPIPFTSNPKEIEKSDIAKINVKNRFARREPEYFPTGVEGLEISFKIYVWDRRVQLVFPGLKEFTAEKTKDYCDLIESFKDPLPEKGKSRIPKMTPPLLHFYFSNDYNMYLYLKSYSTEYKYFNKKLNVEYAEMSLDFIRVLNPFNKSGSLTLPLNVSDLAEKEREKLSMANKPKQNKNYNEFKKGK